MWDATTSVCVSSFVGHVDHIQALDVAPTRDLFATGGRDGVVRLWDLRTDTEVAVMPQPSDEVFSLHFDLNSTVLAAGYGVGNAHLWDLRSHRIFHTFGHHKEQCRSAEFSPDGKWLLTTSFDSTVAIVQVDDDSNLTRLTDHTDRVVQASWHGIMPWILSCGVDKSVRLWSTRQP
mmetsp:Transcript_3091/g.7974  ORF Transcript_3091/g.7974 Transcript_3091/m.7974 type:complete len:176 (-) Transcript_3091:27-554(-)